MATNEATADDPQGPNNFVYDELFPALKIDSKPKTQTGLVSKSAAPFPNQNCNMKIQSTQITQIMSVSADKRKNDTNDSFGEGESLRICQSVAKETGTVIEACSNKENDLTFVITGKHQAVINAKNKLQKNFQTQPTIQINIPKDHHRLILGKSGQKLKDMEQKFGVKIVIPGKADQSDIISVTGVREAIDKAVHHMRVISDEQSKKAFERVTVPKIYHPFITGALNEKLTELAEETGARINVPPSTSESEEIAIAGDIHGVEMAKKRIMGIYEEMKRSCQAICMQVPKWQHKYVIGPKGATVTEILQQTGVSVEVPPQEAEGETITLRAGDCKRLGDALTILRMKATSMQSFEINVPERIHQLVMGKRMSFLRELQDMYKQCHVELAGDKIRVESLPEVLDEIKQKLEQKVYYYMFEYDIVEIPVNPDYIKHIIGKKGVNVKRLKEEHDVVITLPDKDSTNNPEKNCIKIEGTKANVVQVKKELEEQIFKLENEKELDINIHHRHHRTLNANKREKIREFQDKYKVVISFPDPGDTRDNVKIRGWKQDVDACYSELSKIIKEMDQSSYCLEVPIYKQFHKCIIGKGGCNIKKIRDETGTKIDLPAEGENSDVIMITGKKEMVEEARKMILSIQNNMENIVTEEISIPAKFLVKRKLVQAIKEDCGGVIIKLPAPESKSDKIIIRGPSEDVTKAKQQLIELVAGNAENNYTLELKANPDHHRFMIGKHGSKIKGIRDKTGAKIIFPGANDDDKETILIIGKKDQCELAKSELEAIINQINNTTEEVIEVDPKYHKSFISNRGELVHKITEDCGGVVISFPRNMGVEPSNKVVVKGNVNGVRDAIKAIEKHVHELENKYEDEVVVAPRHHKHFVSRKGKVLQSIVSECGGYDHVVISFPRSDNNDSKVLLKGSKDAVLNAKAKILQIVQELENQIQIDVVIPNRAHRNMLISKTYPTVQDIRRACNVRINFPDRLLDDSQSNGLTENGHSSDEIAQPRPCDIVKINGSPENCELARKMLMELIHVECELPVPMSYHKKIVGQKGNVIKELVLKYDVYIDVPSADSNIDYIMIRGRHAAVESVKEEILELMKEIDNNKEEWERNNYEIELDVNPEYHPYIIGRKGEVINSIRADFGVQISLPKKNENSRVITIIGVQENAEKAREAILAIIEKMRDRYREEIKIDPRVHPRLIGKKGNIVRKMMNNFEVEIRYPRDSDPYKDIVVIKGNEDDVLDCKDELLRLEETYMMDLIDQAEVAAAAERAESKEGRNVNGGGGSNTRGAKVVGGKAPGFVLKNAPWDQKAPDTNSISDFPSFGGGGSVTVGSGGGGAGVGGFLCAADAESGMAADTKTFPQLETKLNRAWGPSRNNA